MPTTATPAYRARAALELRRREREGRTVQAATPPEDWREWLPTMFPSQPGAFRVFAPHHEEFWDWVDALEADSEDAFVGIWPREGAKSTSAEAAVARLGLKGVKMYALYVCATQEAADKRVQNIGSLLEHPSVEKYYPAHSERAVNKYGDSKGWRRNRLMTSGGLVVDAAGLDTSIRGLTSEARRPNLIILDDIDAKLDTEHATRKKMAKITHDILPAGTTGETAVIAIQNLIIPNGIFSRLADGRADFLAHRTVSGPHPAIVDMKVEREPREDGGTRAVVVDGEPTWAWQSLDKCQKLIDRIGLTAFIQECQHQVQDRDGALWSRALLTASKERARNGIPQMTRVVVGVDPSGGGDDIGIIVAGVGVDGHAYVFEDRSQPGDKGPLNWGREAVQCYVDYQADRIAGEKNYGGDMVRSNIVVAAAQMGVGHISYKDVNATRGKAVRAEPVASLFEDGRAHLAGEFPELEAELTGWVPSDPESPNRLDAMVWAITELAIKGGRKAQVSDVKYN